MNSLLQFFAYDHLPPFLQTISKPYHDIAHALAKVMPANAESTTALRKLLESKDCAVRSLLFVETVAVGSMNLVSVDAQGRSQRQEPINHRQAE